MMQRTDTIRRGFSLVELLLSIFILGIGIISVAAIFPAGIAQQQQSRDDLMGPVVASQAMSTIRAKVGQEDFGTFEQFQLSSWEARKHLDGDMQGTIPGDWGWMRPSFLLDPTALNQTPGTNLNPGPLHGAIDIFGLRHTRNGESYPALPDYSGENATYMTTSDMARLKPNIEPDGIYDMGQPNIEGKINISTPPFGGDTRPHRSTNPLEVDTEEPDDLRGIPYNRAKYLILDNPDPDVEFAPPDYRFNPVREGRVEPQAMITQGERAWPQGAQRAEYYWDCMFRRYQGRIQVAIFVYRVGFGGQGPRPYAVASHTGPLPTDPGVDPTPLLPQESPIPARVDFGSSENNRWYPTGLDPDSALDDLVVPGTAPSGGVLAPGLDAYKEGWQYPGQWILDQHGNVHRVLSGRRSRADGPVRLTNPVPYVSQAVINGNLFDADLNVITDPAEASAVKSIWFIPPETRNGVFLTPVYVMVKEL